MWEQERTGLRITWGVKGWRSQGSWGVETPEVCRAHGLESWL